VNSSRFKLTASRLSPQSSETRKPVEKKQFKDRFVRASDERIVARRSERRIKKPLKVGARRRERPLAARAFPKLNLFRANRFNVALDNIFKKARKAMR